MSQELVLWVLGQAITAATIYAAIRADIARLMERTETHGKRLDHLETRKPC